jgi:hypothetical protein
MGAWVSGCVAVGGCVILGTPGCGSSRHGEQEAPLDAGADADAGDPSDFKEPPRSCSMTCPVDGCAENTTPYACPALAPWDSLPHADTCAPWDGTYPTPAPTKCTAAAASADAVKYAGADPDDASLIVLPDGRRVMATGAQVFTNDPSLPGEEPFRVLPVPQTSYLVVVDAGYGVHAVQVVDTTKIAGGAGAIVSYVAYPAPKTLNAGVVFVPPDLVLVASDDGVVEALTLDTTTGTLAEADSRSIALPESVDDTGNEANWYASGLALSPDATKLVVTSVFDHRLLVFDVTTAGYGTPLGSVDLGDAPTQTAAFDPNDPTGHFVYVTEQGNRKLIEVDVSNPAAPAVAQSWGTDKNPYGIAFLDARWVVASNDFGDTLTVVDRTTSTVTSVPADATTPLHGGEPTSLAYDAANKVLYATMAGENAVAAWNVDPTMTPPTFTPAGRIPTSWWPTDVAVLADGSLAITDMRGISSGADPMQYPVGSGNPVRGPMYGSVQLVPPPSAMDLTSGDAAVTKNDEVGGLSGAPTVTCPNGEDDFPLPPTNTEGPSKQIDHVFFIVRENKTFDALLGDLPGVNGDPSLTMKTSSADMDKLWLNFRDAARQFAVSDNYYTSAEVSVQGHVWTAFGRTFDFDERAWFLTGYGGRQLYDTVASQPQGVIDTGRPAEGSVFDWLAANNVPYDAFTEALALVSAPPVGTHNPLHLDLPGGPTQANITYPDVERACYEAAHVRVFCDLGNFVYALLLNDHTSSVAPGVPSPEAMVAVNDDATGIFLDAVSHSPWWKSSLVVVTEDDPADGGDDVENHRTPVLFVSPWIKHGYVSKQHIDVSSIHKIFAHVFGIPYPNDIVANAALPLDLFSSTPDYTPFERQARQWPLSCGTTPSLVERRLQQSWAERGAIDEQPGLGAQVWRHMRGQPATVTTPAIEAQMAEAMRRAPRHVDAAGDRR